MIYTGEKKKNNKTLLVTTAIIAIIMKLFSAQRFKVRRIVHLTQTQKKSRFSELFCRQSKRPTPYSFIALGDRVDFSP